MKWRVLFLIALAVVLTFAFATTAFAEHSPSNYSQYSHFVGDNDITAFTPHAGYTTGTVKCNVCHAIHRTAVMGQLIRNQVNGAWVMSSETAPTQMLLRSSVAESCKYCHIDTGVGGVRLWNGNWANWGEAGAFSGGYAHNNTACTSCHAVHGANTFKGAAASKLLVYTATQHTRVGTFDGSTDPKQIWGINPNVPGNVANHTYLNPDTGVPVVIGMQDEIYTNYSAETSRLVAPGNKSQFTDLAGVIEGDAAKTINSAVGADMKDLQVGAFCTTCHQTYASDSAAVLNIDNDAGLYGGTYGLWKSVAGFENESGTWRGKGHPVADATNDFAAAGSTLGTGKTVAWSDADTCRKCHDAGTDDAAPGVVYSSWPHITPGYYRFMGAGASAAEYAGVDVTQRMSGSAWLAEGAKVNTDSVQPLPNEASLFNRWPGQNYKSDNTGNPQQSDHIGTDGLCLKCHVQSNTPGAAGGVGHSY